MDFDRTLRRKIAELNNEGGFDNQIIYRKIADVALCLDPTAVMSVLDNLVEKKDDVKEPTAWVTKALRNMGGGAVPSMPMQFSAGPFVAFDISADRTVSKRIKFLNTEGGFENALIYDKVVSAAQGLSNQQVMQILKNVEEKKDEVRDPTAFVTSACRKAGGGSAMISHGFAGGGSAMISHGFGMPAAIPAAMPTGSLFDPNADRRLRGKIAFLNNEGGYANSLNYRKVLEVAQFVPIEQTMEVLENLESKTDVKDATAFVTAGLRKRAQRGNAAQGVNAGADPDRQVRRRIAYLNNEGGFANQITYTKVMEAAASVGGVDIDSLMGILQEVESKQATVRDPTAYVCASLKKGGRGPSYAPSHTGPIGVKKTIVKKEKGAGKRAIGAA